MWDRCVYNIYKIICFYFIKKYFYLPSNSEARSGGDRTIRREFKGTEKNAIKKRKEMNNEDK